jgi:hypothetical protein
VFAERTPHVADPARLQPVHGESRARQRIRVQGGPYHVDLISDDGTLLLQEGNDVRHGDLVGLAWAFGQDRVVGGDALVHADEPVAGRQDIDRKRDRG